MTISVGLISGGLDSMLAARVLQDQGIQVIGVSFVTPFFGSERAKRAAAMLGIELRIKDITHAHLEMVQSPKHGYTEGGIDARRKAQDSRLKASDSYVLRLVPCISHELQKVHRASG